jgi:hypothetical protein
MICPIIGLKYLWLEEKQVNEDAVIAARLGRSVGGNRKIAL